MNFQVHMILACVIIKFFELSIAKMDQIHLIHKI